VNGESRTGATTMQVEAGLDTGPVLLRRETEIGPDETAPELATRLAEIGAPLVAETVRKLSRGEIKPEPQDGSQATSAPILKKEDGRIEWSQPAQAIYNRIRGLQPWPGTLTSFRGKTCHIWGTPAPEQPVSADPGNIIFGDRTGPATQAVGAGPRPAPSGNLLVACGSRTALRLEFVQLEGRKRVTAREFSIGARLTPSDHFPS